MSYILEALRRADAERQRGVIPGLHAQTAGGIGATGLPLTEGAEREGAHRRWLLRTLVAAVALLALAAAWWLGQGSARDASAPGMAPGTATHAAADSAPMPPPPLATLQPPVLARQPPAAAQPVAAAELPVPPLPAPAVGSLAAMKPMPAHAASAVISAQPSTQPEPAMAAAAVSAAPAAAKAGAASAPEPLLAWAAVPEATRASLPRLAWSGVVYADQPAQRLVVVNGQVLREGDEIAPGLRLEQIRPRSAVLRWRGQRIEMPL